MHLQLQQALAGGVHQHALRSPTTMWRLDLVFPVVGDRQVVVEFDGSYWHRGSYERDPRKAEAIEAFRPDRTVVRVREDPLPLTRGGDVPVPLPTDPFTAASSVVDHLMSMLPRQQKPGTGRRRTPGADAGKADSSPTS